MWDSIWFLFCEYSGNGLAIGLFVLSLVFLLVVEKDSVKRVVLLYTSLVTVLLFFCPLLAMVVFRVADDETYYRILWLIPMSAVIAYAGASFVQLVAKKVGKRAIARALALFLSSMAFYFAIAYTGQNVYENPNFTVAENRFHVPQVVADVCDAITVEGREVRAVVPSLFLPYVRQYTANICLAYGREMLYAGWGSYNDLFDAMREDEISCKKVARLAEEADCQYIILHETTPLKGSFKKTAYKKVDTVDGFDIYLWKKADITYIGLQR